MLLLDIRNSDLVLLEGLARPGAHLSTYTTRGLTCELHMLAQMFYLRDCLPYLWFDFMLDCFLGDPKGLLDSDTFLHSHTGI